MLSRVGGKLTSGISLILQYSELFFHPSHCIFCDASYIDHKQTTACELLGTFWIMQERIHDMLSPLGMRLCLDRPGPACTACPCAVWPCAIWSLWSLMPLPSAGPSPTHQ
jgi:hypothetical protein